MKKLKNNLDERQEQILLQIEHKGCWLAFWTLLASIVIETIIFQMDVKAIAGEFIVFMSLAVYLFSACMKNNIWDRYLKPDGKTNLLISIVAALAGGAVNFIFVWVRYPQTFLGALAAGILFAMFIFIPCIFVLTISAKIMKKNIREEENQAEEM